MEDKPQTKLFKIRVNYLTYDGDPAHETYKVCAHTFKSACDKAKSMFGGRKDLKFEDITKGGPNV